MSRHSKNNTASCVFTNGERLKLKKQNEWGDISARMGSNNLIIIKVIHKRNLSNAVYVLN